MSKLSHDKFSIAQMTSNGSGKTSGSGSMGVLICTVGCICFLLGSIAAAFLGNASDIIVNSLVLIGIGSGLLGYRKSKDNSSVEQ